MTPYDLIAASHLHKSFGNTHAVNDISLTVAAGEIYGLVGPDGAGKTTTLRLLCGALRPDGDGSRIHIAGLDMLKQTEAARAHIGYLAQRFALYEDLTVLENLRFFAEVRGLSEAEWRPRCLEILQFVGLADFVERRAGQLSGGMKQKLGLAAALVHRPQVLLLDEPTTGVDPVTRQDFWQLILRLTSTASPSHLRGTASGGKMTPSENDGGVAVLVSTPYMDEAARCHRVGFMRGGKILIEGTPQELRSRLAGRVVELRGQPLTALRDIARADAGVEDAQMFGDRLHLRVRPALVEQVIARLGERLMANGSQISLLKLVEPSLEDVFISLLENGDSKENA